MKVYAQSEKDVLKTYCIPAMIVGGNKHTI